VDYQKACARAASGIAIEALQQLWYKKPPADLTRIIGFILKVPDGAWIR
jgi:hypothetical protein